MKDYDYTPEIVRMLEEGKTTEEIAKILKRSRRTIEDRLRKEGYGKDGECWYKRSDDVQERQQIQGGVRRTKKTDKIGAWISTLRAMARNKKNLNVEVSSDITDYYLEKIKEKYNIDDDEIVQLGIYELYKNHVK
ncbi:hypothetical protein BTO30_02920 [Domibacillus antri]|uniref:Uncharacterized protein n=1 Tax=Domibacillus antri TaxID=1714264 RepID=A0A1Q8Q8U4_9BACI|nr:helix-turn-helix domain-containing protein [Domibacillus antri]OLN23705.1 hypothetical protein BTO30_02920 [Domibacillus antri]